MKLMITLLTNSTLKEKPLKEKLIDDVVEVNSPILLMVASHVY